MFAKRTSWSLAPNRYTVALEEYRQLGKDLLDLTASNPTIAGFQYRNRQLLEALARPEALTYEPSPMGLAVARAAAAVYYAERGSVVWPEDLVLTSGTSEGYSFIFRLLCNPGEAVLVPRPSYPLFEFLADIQDVKLIGYELVYDHGWQIDLHSLRSAIEETRLGGLRAKAILVVHPNNPTGSFVQADETGQLNRICASHDLALVADEVFLDYNLANGTPLTFATNADVLTFTLSGVSKISGLPQMKLAWIAVNGPEVAKGEALSRLEVIADTYLSMGTPVQWAAPELLDERGPFQRQARYRITENLAELDAQLARQKLCRRLDVDGGWYAILRVPVKGSDEDLAIALLRETGTLVQPGHFYDFPGEGFLVISLITPREEFADGTGRLLQFIEGYEPG